MDPSCVYILGPLCISLKSQDLYVYFPRLEYRDYMRVHNILLYYYYSDNPLNALLHIIIIIIIIIITPLQLQSSANDSTT